MPIIAPVHSDVEIETAIIALGREPGGGLIVKSDPFTGTHHAPIILAAARNKVPAVYVQSHFARDGGLLSYGVDRVDIWRRAASYADRILRGAKPSELPVQFPTKFEMVVNLKTAKALDLTVPQSILRAPTRSSNETQGFHRGARKRSGVADGGAGAAVVGAGDRVSQRPIR